MRVCRRDEEKLKAGYPPKALDEWAAARTRAGPLAARRRTCHAIDPDAKAKKQPRDVFIYFIHEAKVRAPAAAMALIERVGRPG